MLTVRGDELPHVGQLKTSDDHDRQPISWFAFRFVLIKIDAEFFECFADAGIVVTSPPLDG